MASASSPPSTAGLNNNVRTLLAPFLYGGVISSLLLGALLMQTWTYYRRFPKDRCYYKVTVGLLVVISLVVWGATLFLLDRAFIEDYGSLLDLHSWPTVIFTPLAAPTLSAALSQALFARRLYTLMGRKRWLAGTLVVLMAGSIVSGLFAIALETSKTHTAMNGSDLPLYSEAEKAGFWKIITANEAFLWTSALIDLTIALCLAWCLSRRRKESYGQLNEESNALLKRVLLLSITTGSITAVFSIATAVLVLATVNANNLSEILVFQLSHCYALVCIASLNLRRGLSPASLTRSSDSREALSSPRSHSTSSKENFMASDAGSSLDIEAAIDEREKGGLRKDRGLSMPNAPLMAKTSPRLSSAAGPALSSLAESGQDTSNPAGTWRAVPSLLSSWTSTGDLPREASFGAQKS